MHNENGFLSSLPRKREAVRQFTPSWFTVTMGTGSVALSISAFPYHFPGQSEIGLAVWCLNVLLFISFACLLLGRLLVFFDTIPKLLAHPNQSLFCGALPMAFSTITNGVIAFLLPRSSLAADVSLALFWINIPLVLLCVCFIPLSMSTVHEHSSRSMTALWLLPVVPACVAANTAGVVANSLDSQDRGMTLVVTGICLLGIGFLLSYQICAIYYQRLIIHSLPAREMIISSFLPVGPMAMTAWASMNLVLAATRHLGKLAELHPEQLDPQGLKTLLPVGVGIAAVVGMFLWGFATWWLLLAICSISTLIRQGIPFNLGWWGSVFPVGVYTGATIMLGNITHSTTFKIIGAICVCCHVLLWLVVVTFTAWSAWTGKLFHAPCLAGPAAGTTPPAAYGAVTAAAGRNCEAAAQEVELKLQRHVSSRGSTDLEAAADAAVVADSSSHRHNHGTGCVTSSLDGLKQ